MVGENGELRIPRIEARGACDVVLKVALSALSLLLEPGIAEQKYHH
jgi:hypothetical protein